MHSHLSKYKTKTEYLNISGLSVKLVTVTNIDELYEELIQKGSDHADVKDERIPYWTQLWASAIALSHHIVRTKIIKKKMKVLEIGCGLGLPGIVAGTFGAEITFTDYIKEPLELAKHNWKLNHSHEAQFKILDWRKPDPVFAADVLLASDVAYEKRSFNFLIKAFNKLIKTGGLILLSEPNRHYARDFFISLKNKGFMLSAFTYEIENFPGETKVNVYEIKLK